MKIRFSHSSLCLRPNLSFVKCSVKMENTMKKLLVYLKDYKKESVLGPLFKLLEATFELIVPLVMAAIIDTGVATGDKSYIMKMCI